jgi:predicted small metal-binding protein
MVYTLVCRDTGVDCDFVAKGDTKEELMQIAGKHGKEVHAYTDAQLQDPQMMEKMNSLVKEE